MKKLTFLLFAACIATCFVVLLNGCETTSAASEPYITPSSTTVRVGHPVEFTASGGFDYIWTLKDDTMGRPRRCSPEVREREVWMAGELTSQLGSVGT